MLTPINGMLSRSHPVAQGQLPLQTPQQILEQAEQYKTVADEYTKIGQVDEAEKLYQAAQKLFEEETEKLFLAPQSEKIVESIYLSYGLLLNEQGRRTEAEALEQKRQQLFERYKPNNAGFSKKRTVERESSSLHLNKKNHPAAIERLAGVDASLFSYPNAKLEALLDSSAEAQTFSFKPILTDSAGTDYVGVETLVQSCHGMINAPVSGLHNTVTVHYHSAEQATAPLIGEFRQEMNTVHANLTQTVEKLVTGVDGLEHGLSKLNAHAEAECYKPLAQLGEYIGELKATYLDRFKEQQALELRSKKEPLAILGRNIEAEYFTAWEEPGEIQDGLAMYVAPHATTVTDKKSFFDLDEAVTAFLTQANDSGQRTQVLLLRGEAGSGKSTFNRHLARRLWRGYSATSGEQPIPLYISLPTLDRPNKNLMGQYLSDKCGFSPEQIDALRASQRFILILDGYDEIPAEQRNLYEDEKLDQWQAKILLSCRPEYLTEGYKNHLQPRGCSRVLVEYQLAPFLEQSIETYIHQYVEYTQAQWSAQDYQDRLVRIPNIKELLGTPFLLKMALSVLPTLDETRPGQVALTRIKLYEQFVQTWFERSLVRLDAIQSKLTETQKNAFYGLKEDGFIEHSQTFNTDFALALSEAKTTVAAYSPIVRRGMSQNKRYEAFLSNQDEGKKLLRFSALLTRQQQQYRFIHKSIQDYLVARAVWEGLEIGTGFNASVRGVALNWTKNMQRVWEELTDSDQVDPEGLLNRLNLVEDAAIQRFLVERVEQDQGLVKPLLGWVKASAQTESVSQGAANAMTILVGAGIQFNGMDLQGIRISGADLRGSVFDSAQLQGADLSGVKLRQSWLRKANLSGAQMAGVQFGEWPYLKEKSGVNSCAYSPDGKSCAVGLRNHKISVYMTSNWKKMHTLRGHTHWVNSVVYSPSGTQIASGSQDQTVRLWDAESGALVHTLQGHTWPVNSVVYSPSGTQIASGSQDQTVRLWDAESGTLGHTLKGHTDSVNSVVYSPSGTQIASGSQDQTVRLWDAESGALGHTLKGHGGSVTSVVYSPSGMQIASGSEDTMVRLWDAQSGAFGHTLKGHDDSVTSVVYSPSETQIALGSWDQTVRLWDAESRTLGHTLEGHTAPVTGVVYSPSGTQIASASQDKTVRLWDAQSGALGHTLKGHISSVTSVVYSPSGLQIASGSRDNTVRLWDAQSGAFWHTLEGHINAVLSVVYSPSGTQIASGSYDATVRLWDAQSGALGHILKGHTYSVTSVVYSPSGTQIASGSRDQTVRLWDAQSGALGHTLRGHTHWVTSVVYSPSGMQIASGSEDTMVRLWDAQSGALGHTLKGHDDSVTSVVYSPSGTQIASGSGDKTVRLWDIVSGECLRVIQEFRGAVFSVAWKATGNTQYLVSGSADKSVRQWEIEKDAEGDKVKLCWSTGHDELNVWDTLIEGAEGLSEMNRALMKQRGASVS